MTMRLRDVMISVIASAPQCSQTGSLMVIVRRRRNTWLLLFNKLISVKFCVSNSTLFATVIREHFGMAGLQCA